MPSTTRRTRAERTDRRAEIEARLRDAITKLVKQGETFTELSVERLVAEVGISRSTFYVYFEDKAALLRSLGAESMHSLYDGARLWIGKGEDATREDIRAGMRQLLGSFRESEVIMVALAETAVYDPVVREEYRKAVDDYIRATRKLIQRGEKSGKMRRLERPAETAAALAWMTERSAFQMVPGATPRQLDAVAEGLAEAVWATLYDAGR
jgi:AcrR family transcriptional regulator